MSSGLDKSGRVLSQNVGQTYFVSTFGRKLRIICQILQTTHLHIHSHTWETRQLFAFVLKKAQNWHEINAFNDFFPSPWVSRMKKEVHFHIQFLSCEAHLCWQYGHLSNRAPRVATNYEANLIPCTVSGTGPSKPLHFTWNPNPCNQISSLHRAKPATAYTLKLRVSAASVLIHVF